MTIARGRRWALGGTALVAFATACTPPPVDPRPSFLLVVVDTLRADAVSAYGAVESTTPHLDALAREGLRYTRAFAPAPWTLPSHATILTGADPVRHGVGIGGRIALPEDIETLAERLTDAGYEAVGFSENPLVSAPFGMARGFAHFASELVAQQAQAAGDAGARLDVVRGVRDWAGRRDAARPFFVFVNLFDVHDPYVLHPDHLFLPPGVDVARAEVERTGAPLRGIAEVAGICDRLPGREDLAIVRGLYLGEVAAADAKLGAIQRALAEAAGARILVTVATADHGEHLGEARLLGHEFSLRNEVLHVPLVVHGLPGVAPAVIDTPVGLADIAPSLLGWAGLDVPVRLPREAGGGTTPDHPLLASFSDHAWQATPNLDPQDPEGMDRRRRGCGPGDRVFGDMVAVLDFPWKLVWYRRYAPQLFDLSWDPHERSDLAGHEPAVVTRLERALDPLRRRLDAATEVESADPTAVEALRALGYGQ